MSDINFCPNCGHDLTKYNKEAYTEDRDLWKDALTLAAENGKVSTSLLQKKLRIGYGRAARIMETMEEHALIGKADGSRPRDVNTEIVKAILAEG